MEECLPDEAGDRRRFVVVADLFRQSDFGLIMPPMVEYLDSPTSGVGQDLLIKLWLLRTVYQVASWASGQI